MPSNGFFREMGNYADTEGDDRPDVPSGASFRSGSLSYCREVSGAVWGREGKTIYISEIIYFCGGQAKLATDLEFFQNNRSDSFGVKPPLY